MRCALKAVFAVARHRYGAGPLAGYFAEDRWAYGLIDMRAGYRYNE